RAVREERFEGAVEVLILQSAGAVADRRSADVLAEREGRRLAARAAGNVQLLLPAAVGVARGRVQPPAQAPAKRELVVAVAGVAVEWADERHQVPDARRYRLGVAPIGDPVAVGVEQRGEDRAEHPIRQLRTRRFHEWWRVETDDDHRREESCSVKN